MSTDGVDVDTLTTQGLADRVGLARTALADAAGFVDPHAATIGDPANDSSLRSLLETVIGGWLRDLETADGTIEDLHTRLTAVATAFPDLDVELATPGSDPYP